VQKIHPEILAEGLIFNKKGVLVSKESHINDIMMVCKMFPEFMRKQVIDKGKYVYKEIISNFKKK